MRGEVQCVPEFEDDLGAGVFHPSSPVICIELESGEIQHNAGSRCPDPLRRPDPAYRQTEEDRIAQEEVHSKTFDRDLPRFEACNYAFHVPTDMCCMAESDYLFIAEKGSYPPCDGRIVRLNVSAGTVKVIIAAAVEQQNKQQIYAFTIFMNINMSNAACTTFHLWRLPSNMGEPEHSDGL